MANSVSDLLKKVNATRKKILDSTDLDEKIGRSIQKALTSKYNPYTARNFAISEALGKRMTKDTRRPVRVAGGFQQEASNYGKNLLGNTYSGISDIARGKVGQGTAKLGTAGLLAAQGVSAVAQPGRSITQGLMTGGFNAGLSALTGGDPYADFGRGTFEGIKTAGVTRFTDPRIQQAVGRATPFARSFVGRQIATRGITGAGNVAEDTVLTALQRLNNQDVQYTPGASFLLGAAMGGNAEIARGVNNKLVKPGIKALEPVANSARKLMIPVKEGGKQTGTIGTKLVKDLATGNARVRIRKPRVTPEVPDSSYQPRDAQSGQYLEKAQRYFKDVAGNLMDMEDKSEFVEVAPGKFRRANDLETAYGGLAGMEMYQDENGEWKMRFNPQKAAAGMLVAGGLKAVKGNLPTKGVGDLNDVKNRLLKVVVLPEVDKTAIKNASTIEELAPYLRKLEGGSLAKFFNNQPTKGVEAGNIPLKPKTDLLNQAEQLRKQGYEALVENQTAAQEAANLRSMFSDDFFDALNRLKRYARSKKVQSGDTETLRARDSKTFDRVTMAVREAFGDDTMSDDAAIQQALSIPTKQDTKVSRPIEFVQAKELEQKAKRVRDLVYNAQAAPETKAKVLAQNQKAIEKAAIDEFERENREFFEQVGATRTKRQQANANMREALKMLQQTTPSYVDESVKDISGLNAGLSTLTRNLQKAFGKNFEAVKKDVLDPFDSSKGQMYKNLDDWSTKIRYITDDLGIKMKSKESAAVQEFGEGNISRADVIAQFGEQKANQIFEAASWFRLQYDALLDEVNQVRAAIYGENSDKLIPKRKDYFRHFHDLSSTFGGLKNIFENSAAITPSLAGTSQVTRPKSKWLSFAQRRLGNKTDIDAVGGFIDYVTAAEYAKNVDPHIQKFRDLRQGLVDYAEANQATVPNGLNNLIEYLDDFTNDLAGKTNPYDRPLQKIVGRKTLSLMNWLNSRIKANVIVGNLSSSVAQFFNIPQGIAEAGVGNYLKGANRAVTSVLDDNAVSNQSNFLRERYSTPLYDQFNESLLAKPKQFAAWITGIGDEIGTRSIWNALYEKALKEGVKDPVNYADNVTRDMVAGRGIGEVPLLQKSKTLQLLAPFQLEVANSWYVMKKWAGEKQAKKLITFFVASYLMNQGAKAIRGSDVVFDPIQAGMDALDTYNEEENKQTGAIMAGGRLAGEVLSNIPFVQSVAGLYPEYGLPIGGMGEDGKRENITREELFGEGDPTRFGSGLLLGKGITDPLFKVAPAWGGAQLKKTLEGANTLRKGYSETKAGKIRFTTNKNPINAAQMLAFGQYSTPMARNYFDAGSPSLSEKQSAQYKSILDSQGKQAAQQYFQMVQDDKAARGVKSLNTKEPGLIDRLFGNDNARAQVPTAIEQNLPTSSDELITLYKSATSTLEGIEERRTKAKYGQYDSELKRQEALEKLDQDETFAKQMLNQIESKNPEAVFDYGLETYKSGSGATVEQRGEWVFKTLENVNEDKLQDTINKMWEAKVLTTGSNGVAAYFKDTYGIDLKYTGTDKKIKSSSGGKKIKLGAPKKLNLVSTVKAPPKVNFRGSSKINTANLLKLQAPPKTAKSVTPKLKILKQPNLTV